MARLEYIHYKPHRPEVDSSSRITWVPEVAVRLVEKLPQIFWADGSPWVEANLWALESARSRDVKLKTIRGAMEHLHKYANWLEEKQVDWRHFPLNKAERVLVQYRGALVESRDRGEIAPSTTSARMQAVIRFYRYCAGRNFISRDAPKWEDKAVVVRYFDAVGFERTLHRLTADISIPNRKRPGVRLEDGLLPLSQAHMSDLLRFAEENSTKELYLMLMIGFFTGARLGTILTLRVTALEEAQRDPKVPGMWIVPVGPGTDTATKFDVSGDLMIPEMLMAILKAYAMSRRHLDRVIKASSEHKLYLFLTRHNKPYQLNAVHREMVNLRRAGQAAGLKYLQKFRFHQTRATYGTWLMSICLKAGSAKAAVEFVKRAMHHRHEATTFRYITFIEHTQAKIELANAFTEAFLGFKSKLKGGSNAS